MTHARLIRISMTTLLSGALCVGAGATIENVHSSDTRGMSMGGATLASVDDAAAGLVNPAVLGFMKREAEGNVDNNNLGEHDFGWNLIELGMGGVLTGDLGDYLEALGGIDFADFGTGKLENPDNLTSLLTLANALGNVNENDTIVVSATAGTAMQIGHFGIGVRSFGQIGGWINDLDLVRIGLEAAAADILTELENAFASEGFDPATYIPKALSGDQRDQLTAAFNEGPIDDVVKYIDFKVSELIADGTISEEQIAGAIDTIATMVENAAGAGTQLSDNQTSITGRGFGAIEIPISYGYALNDNFSVGLTAKAMLGRVFGTQVWAFNENNTEIVKDSLDSSEDSFAIGLDAAVMYRIPKAQFALVGRNLNRPRFSGYDQKIVLNGVAETFTVPDVVLDPQVTIGAAFIPFKRMVLESDLELLETGTILNSYNIQRLSFGTELDLTLLALRLGTYKNLAQSDFGWVLTGGVGFNLWALSVDLGLALSIDDTVEYDGVDYPRTARIHAGIGLTF